MPKISALDTATTLAGSEAVPLVQGGATKRTTAAQLLAQPPFIATGATAARSLADRFADVVSLKDFGAVGDGVTDNSAAWTKLFAAYPTGSIVVEGGGFVNYYYHSTTITPPAGCSNVTLRNFHFYAGDNHTHDLLSLPATVSGWVLDKPVFSSASGGSGTTEVWAVRDASGADVIDAFFLNVWSGAELTGSKHFWRGRTLMENLKASTGRGMLVNMSSAEVCEIDDAILLNADGADCLVGVHVKSGSAIRLGGTASHCGTPLKVDPDSGQVVATLALWPMFNGDSSTASGATFTGSGTIQRVEGYLRLTSNTGKGLDVVNIPASCDLLLRLADNGDDGAAFAGGDYNESRFRIAAYGNDGDGAAFAADCSNFTAEVVAGDGDGFGTNIGYGVSVGSGCSDFRLRVDGAGGTSGRFSCATTLSATEIIEAPGADRTWDGDQTFSAGLIVGSSDLTTAWTTYTPSVASITGSLTAYTVNSAQYKLMGKTLFLSADISITTNGTAATALTIGLPAFKLAKNPAVGSGREDALTGAMLQVWCEAGSGDLNVAKYDNTYGLSDGSTVLVSAVIETE